jgi:hypothetical protein
MIRSSRICQPFRARLSTQEHKPARLRFSILQQVRWPTWSIWLYGSSVQNVDDDKIKNWNATADGRGLGVVSERFAEESSQAVEVKTGKQSRVTFSRIRIYLFGIVFWCPWCLILAHNAFRRAKTITEKLR